jgi:hypothetical protein
MKRKMKEQILKEIEHRLKQLERHANGSITMDGMKMCLHKSDALRSLQLWIQANLPASAE